MKESTSNPSSFRVGSWLGVLAVAGVLYFAQAVFVPLALALLLSFLLAPLIRGLERRGLQRVPAVALGVLLSVGVISALAALVVYQAVDLTENLPSYRQTLDSKLETVRGRLDRFERVASAIDVRRGPSGAPGAGSAPLRVQMVENRWAALGALAGPVLAPLATAGLVLVFVIFMLIQWDDLRDRILRLSGQASLSITTRALEDASSRVSYYLQMQLLINAMVGLTFGLGVWAIGVPNAPLAALLLTALRFIPYVGAWVAAAFPLFIAFAAFPGWSHVLLTGALFGVLEVVAGQVLEPWLYRSKTGLSPLGVLISFVFWGWMWGGVGLLLATPLTVCLVVAGQYISQLETLAILLGDQRALAPWARLYHRLLALDADEATSIVDAARARGGSVAELYDSLIAPALAIAERDRQAEQLSEERSNIVYTSLLHFVEADGVRPSRVVTPDGVDVLCLPARSEADHISSVMAAQLLQSEGTLAEATPHGQSLAAIIESVAQQRPQVVVVAALPQLATVSVNERCRKLRDLFPELKILAAVWTNDGVPEATATRWRAAGANDVVSSFEGVSRAVSSLLAPPERLSQRATQIESLPPSA